MHSFHSFVHRDVKRRKQSKTRKVPRDRATRETNRCCCHQPKHTQLSTNTLTTKHPSRSKQHHETTIMPPPTQRRRRQTLAHNLRPLQLVRHRPPTRRKPPRRQHFLARLAISQTARAVRCRSRGGERVSDTVGAGSVDFGRDGRTESGGWVDGAKGLRTGGRRVCGRR